MSSFFDKLGRSLNLEDEQGPSLAYNDDASDYDETPEGHLDEESADTETMGDNLGSVNLPDVDMEENAMDDGMLDEEMLQELSEDESEEDNMAETIATLAATKTKTPAKSSAKTKKPTLVEEGRLNIDVFELPDEIVIKSAIAGVSDDDLDIEITPDSVSIRGVRKEDEEISEEDYFYKECFWGMFSREVRLHTEIDPDKAEAILNNGVLTIRLPKLSKTSQKKLKVKKVG